MSHWRGCSKKTDRGGTGLVLRSLPLACASHGTEYKTGRPFHRMAAPFDLMRVTGYQPSPPLLYFLAMGSLSASQMATPDFTSVTSMRTR